MFFGYFDPENVFCIIKIINFRGELTDNSSKQEALVSCIMCTSLHEQTVLISTGQLWLASVWKSVHPLLRTSEVSYYYKVSYKIKVLFVWILRSYKYIYFDNKNTCLLGWPRWYYGYNGITGNNSSIPGRVLSSVAWFRAADEQIIKPKRAVKSPRHEVRPVMRL